ncbi:MAG TPA: lytic transglycosylase domain-containing protein, partial [Caulobacteraceae bacterium]|nr:lytic transglycosylase domain-containing protein [Caulobacteraceae bacterium]
RQPNCTNVGADLVAGFVTEAATRFGMPESWVRAVMHMESGGDPCVISPAGAQGLMQLMPRTYAELKARYGLGADPFDAHDNLLAGAAYLREMWDRFGAGGFLAAYNAGPARFQDHLITGRPLTGETLAYVAALEPVTAAPSGAVEIGGQQPAPRRPPTLFVQIGGAATAVSATPGVPSDRTDTATPSPLVGHATGLFAAVSAGEVQ